MFALKHQYGIGTINEYYKNYEFSFELRSSSRPTGQFSIVGSFSIIRYDFLNSISFFSVSKNGVYTDRTCLVYIYHHLYGNGERMQFGINNGSGYRVTYAAYTFSTGFHKESLFVFYLTAYIQNLQFHV